MDPYWVSTRDILQPLIRKPRLTDKHLKKPPFRFLQDIVINTIKSTGFPDGLFEDKFLTKIKDKESKIAFLDRLIACVGIVNDTPIPARPSKIVAGLEPEKTNLLLREFAKAANKCLDKKCDLPSVVQRVREGEKAPKSKSYGRHVYRFPKRRRHSMPGLFHVPDSDSHSGVHSGVQHGRIPRPSTRPQSPQPRSRKFPDSPSRKVQHMRSFSRGDHSPSPHSPRAVAPIFDRDSSEPQRGFARGGRNTIGAAQGSYNLVEKDRRRAISPHKGSSTVPHQRPRRRRPSFKPAFDQLHPERFDFQPEHADSPSGSPVPGSPVASSAPVGDSRLRDPPILRSSHSQPAQSLETDDIPHLEQVGFDMLQPSQHIRSLSTSSSRSSSRHGSRPGSRSGSPHYRSNHSRQASNSTSHSRQASNYSVSSQEDAYTPMEETKHKPDSPESEGRRIPNNSTTEEDYILKTQETLGKIIARPQMKPKFLKRPPFRFLHDVVKNVIKTTGYMEGAFTADELNFAVVKKDAKAKLNFIRKLIVFVSLSLRPLPISAKKVIAGIEPENTNLLLQSIAEAAVIKDLDMEELIEKMNNFNKRRQSNKSLTPEEFTKAKARRRSKGGSEGPLVLPGDMSPLSSPASTSSGPTLDTGAQIDPHPSDSIGHESMEKSTDPSVTLASKPTPTASSESHKSHLPIRARPLKQPLSLPEPSKEDNDLDGEKFFNEDINKLERPQTARGAPPPVRSHSVQEIDQNPNSSAATRWWAFKTMRKLRNSKLWLFKSSPQLT